MGSFLSASAQKSQSGSKRPYTIEEDRVICAGLENGDAVSTIVENLQQAGHERTVLSLRYRVTKLREAAEKFETLEAFHKVK